MTKRNLYTIEFEENTRVFIATFSRYEKGRRLPTNGFVEQMLSFFLPKVKNLILLDQPHPVSDTINPIVEVYEDSRLAKKYTLSPMLYLPIYLFCKRPSNSTTRVSYKLRDIISVFYTAFLAKKRSDIFIGLESINALCGIVLRSIGLAGKVIYYVSDYSPTRFGKTIFNKVYLWLDRYCICHADATWDVSPAMKTARLAAGLDPKLTHKIIHVPNALFPNQIHSLPLTERTKNTLVYMGILDLDMGPDLAIEAMQEVVKQVPTAKLHVIGGVKKDVERLQQLVRDLQLEKHIVLYGFIEDNDKMAKIVRSCMVGLAPYRAFPDSYRWYGDAGKIRQYMASGLPVVTTEVPPLGRYVTEKGAAIQRKDTPSDFASGIVQLLSDKKLYKRLSEKAEELAKENTWENTYASAFRQMRSED